MKKYEVKCCLCDSIHSIDLNEDEAGTWIQFCNCNVIPFIEPGQKPYLIEVTFNEILPNIESR